MELGLAVVTVFIAIEELFGCVNITFCPEEILKDDQFMFMEEVFCFMLMVLPEVEIAPDPDVTVPP